MKTRKCWRALTILIFLTSQFVTGAAGFAAGAPYLLYLPLLERAEYSIPIANLLTPFNADANDLLGPSDWNANYGKKPEIIAAPNGLGLDILAQDYNPATAWSGVLLHLEPLASGGYRVAQALTNLPMLDRVMGLAVDAAGNRYYATGVDESSQVNASYPPPNTYRSNIVRVIKLDAAGKVLFNIDLDIARHAFNANAEMIINPMVAATARLAVGGGEIALVHGINTPDSNGVRHQKALSTRLNAVTGAITRTNSIWVSHSFDERLLFDGTGIIETHLGDAYPREIVMGRWLTSSDKGYPLFHIKGPLGQNSVATRLGNMALIQNDATYGYLALFATETSTIAGTMGANMINGPRNLAIVRVKRSDNSLDPSLPDTLTVDSAGSITTNRLKWLTQYSAASNLHAERPKLVGIGADRYIVLWEEWLHAGSYDDTFNGVYAMLIDANGNSLRPAVLLTQQHLPRGDDAFLLNGRAAWVTGSDTDKSLSIHQVDEKLTYSMVTIH